MTSYETKSIRDVTKVLIDYRGKTPKKVKSGVKLITAKVIKGGFIVDGDHEYIADEEYDTWMRRGLPRQWDILITTEAPLGEVAQLRTSEKVALAQRVILLRGDSSVIHQGYFFHALKSPFVQVELRARSSGTTVLGIKQSELWQVEIPCPPIPTQERIASILSAYDDLIENNTRRIRILEEMAQMIYREWFLKFRFPGHDKVKMVESALGLIPDGWDIVRVEDAVQRFPSGKKFEQKTVLPTGRVPVLDQGKSGVIGYHNEAPGVAASYENPIVVFANHTCYQRLILFPFSAIQNVLPFRSSTKYQRDIYWLHWATKDLIRFNDYKGHWPEFVNKRILIPPSDVCSLFGKSVKPIAQSCYVLEKQSENLRQTRDLLLPKLISGEIQVGKLEAEAVAQSV
jgi:type I restriction enzyme, S subunit